MESPKNPQKSKISIYPGYAIFVLSLFFVLNALFILDSILDYQRGIYSLWETYFSLIFETMLFGGMGLGFYIFLFSIFTVDARSGISIFTGFATQNIVWNHIEEIKVILNLQEAPTQVQHGLILIFAKPYYFHTRQVVIRIKNTAGKEFTCRLQVNINKINAFLRILCEVHGFGVSRMQVDQSKMQAHIRKSKRIEANELSGPEDDKKSRRAWNKPKQRRELWLFRRSFTPQTSILYNLLLRDENGEIWDREYSDRAHIIKIVGWVECFLLVVNLFLVVYNQAFKVNTLTWSIFLGGLVFLLIIGIILAFLTPEMQKNSQLL